MKERLYTRDEVIHMLSHLAETYNIEDTDKYKYSHFSNCNDWPSDRMMEKAFKDEIESFII